MSRRTVYRDLDTLEAAGLPVRYRADRQGYQLAKGCFIQPPNLGEKEALALLALARQWGGGKTLGLIRYAHEGALKLAQGLPCEVRGRVLSQAEFFESELVELALPRDRQLVYDAVLEALAQRLQLRIWPRNAARSRETTKLSLYRLLLARGVWHLIGRSTLHRQVRSFAVPTIQRAILTNDPATIPPRFSLKRFLGHAWSVAPGDRRFDVQLRFSEEAALIIRDTIWHPSQRLEPRADGRLDLHLVIDGLDEIVDWVLGFGAQVEVINPFELRERVWAVARRMVLINDPNPHATRSEPGPT